MIINNEPKLLAEQKLLKIVIVTAIVATLLGIVFFLVGNFLPSSKTYAVSATRYAVASGAWNSTATWSATSGGASGASIPVAGDIVYIGEGATARAVTIPAGYTAACSTVFLGSGSFATANSLTLSASNSSLVVSGNFTINRSSGATTNALNVNAGIATVGGIFTLAGTNTTATRIAKVYLTTGSLTVSGNFVAVVGSTTSNIVDMSGGAGTLYLGGSFNAQNCGFVKGTGTVVFNGTVAQTINFPTAGYFNLSIRNINSAVATLSAAITSTLVSGNLVVGDGVVSSSLSTGNFAITLANSKTLTIAEGSILNAGTSMITFGTSGTATINGIFNTANTAGFSGSTTTAIKSTNSPTISLGVNSGIEYTSSSAQTITARTDYDNLTISSGIKTISAGTLTLSNDFLIVSGATYLGSTNNPTLNIAGDFTNNGTFTQGSGAVTLNGNNSQSIGGTSLTSFNNLIINNSSVSAPQIVLDTTVSVSGVLTLTDGIIALQENNLEMASGSSLSGGSINSFAYTSGAGSFKWMNCAASTSKIFPVGLKADTSGYSPLTLTFNSGHTTDNFSVIVDSVLTTNGGSSGTTITSNVIKACWQITESVSGGSNIDMKFEWRTSREGSNLDRTKNCQLLHYTSGAWDRPSGKEAMIAGSGPFNITYTGYTGSFSPFGIEGNDGSVQLSFTGSPSVSGTAGAAGTKYTWSNIGSLDNITIKAVIEIISISGGASLENIDDASTGSVDAWQPIVNGSNTNGNCWAMEFRVRFYNASTNARLTLSRFKAQGIDIDGDGQYIREYNRFDKPTEYSVETSTVLTTTFSSGNYTFKGPTTAENGIDLTKTNYIVTCDYANTDSMNIVLGGCCDGGNCATFTNTRRHSINFTDAVNYISPVPVVMVYFNAEILSETTKLNWATATEVNNSHFEIQRSGDGKNWNNIGNIPGHGNSNNLIKYNYHDPEPLVINYYRLKQIDFDGKNEYSKTIMVSFDHDQLPAKTLYPSLIHQGENTRLNISNVPPGLFKIMVIDLKGNIIFESEYLRNETGMMELVDLGTAALSIGMHFIRLTGETTAETFKFMVK